MHSIRTTFALASAALGLLALAAPAGAQAFVQQTAGVPTGIPFNNSYTEEVDFGDVDLDGDFDAVFADGGDSGNDQNRIWINLGGVQGGTAGEFEDRTDSLFPVVSDDSRDVELADFEGDGDLDLFVSNTSSITNQSAHIWVNQGGEQGGTLGAYADETSSRWIGLGGPGSAVSPVLVLASGGFIAWSADSDFADFDNDGDLDLIHTQYGSAFSANAPTRIFLNDGEGFFSDFNPSGYTPPGSVLANGAPALWAQGIQADDTTDTTGLEADIKGNPLDVDMADQDGDLDVDVLLGSRDVGVPRFFRNLLEEGGGAPAALAFRDVSHLVFPPGWALSNDTYSQEMADIDSDGDVDLYGINWAEGFEDRMFRNNDGTFGDTTTLPDSSGFEYEGDFLDYDNDGDLDLYVANFGGVDRIHRNEDTGSGPIQFPVLAPELAGLADTAVADYDAETGDLDGDGDYDVLVAVGSLGLNGANLVLKNQTQVPDTTAPSLDRLEATAAQQASTTSNPVRVQVYDNASYYVTWYDPTVLDVTVDGCPIASIPMVSSGGQVFRGELPGNLVGLVAYTARSEDRYGNSGTSTTETYVASDLPGGTSASFGADSGAGAPDLRALGVAFPGSTLHVGASGMTPGNAWFLAWNQSALAVPIPIPGIGVANVGGLNYFTYSGAVDASGCGVQAIFLPPSVPAVSTYFQMFEFPADGPDLLDSSRGLRVDIQP